MAGILAAASQRLNAATAGLTGSPTATEVGVPRAGGKGSGAVPEASPAEVLYTVPTEFGDLTGLFGGEAAPSQQYEPMQTALTIPGGSVRGVLGGLKPDFTNVRLKATETLSNINPGGVEKPAGAATINPGGLEAAAPQPAQVPAISVIVKNNVAKARAFLKI